MCPVLLGVEGAGLVPSVGGPPDASFDQHRKDIKEQEY